MGEFRYYYSKRSIEKYEQSGKFCIIANAKRMLSDYQFYWSFKIIEYKD